MATATKEKPEAAKAPTTTSKDIPEKVVNLAGRFKDAFKVTPTGVVETPADLYVQTLPKGITPELAMAVHEHDRDVTSATRLALGEVGIPHLASHKKLDQVSVEFGAGNVQFGAVLLREKQVPDGKGGTKMKYGHSRAFFELNDDTRTLTRINQHLGQLSREYLQQ